MLSSYLRESLPRSSTGQNPVATMRGASVAGQQGRQH